MNVFAEYADELTLLAAEPDPLTALLASRHGAGPWRRTYGRFHPRQPSYCTLLYESGEGALPLRVSLYRKAVAAPRGEAVAGLGVMRVALPTDDEALDTLPAVLARHPGATVVRYRPQHRCTFRAAHGAGAQYVKVFPSGLQPRLHVAQQALWQRRGELGFAVAEPLEFDGALRSMSQAALPGRPLLGELRGPRGLAVAAALGRAAATLPQSALAADVLPVEEPLANTEYQADGIVALLPEFAERVRALVSRLRRQGARCAPPRRLAIHGALHPAQWLRLGDDGLGLVDFDGLGVGEPEFDVATFVTELRYEKRTAIPALDLCHAFTSAYAECVPLDAQRLALYVAHKETAKLLRLARAPRPDAPPRFALALQRIEQAASP